MLLKVKELSFSLEHKKVLERVEIEISKGKINAVLGTNGSGKSTLLRLLAGLLEPEAGEIFFNGEKVTGPSSKLIPGQKGISLVKQDSRLLPFHTVRQNIRHSLQNYHKDFQAKRIEELADLLGLIQNLERPLNLLSGGEQQKVAIAAALAGEPELLLMDEPFSQTDISVKEDLKHYLTDLVKHLEISLLFVTHNPEDALSFSDEILVLDQGKIIEKGNSRELYYFPKEYTTAILTGYASWLPIKSFSFITHLHKVKENFLIRPDQVRLEYVETPDAIEAIVKTVKFSGFYQAVHLTLTKYNLPLIFSQISSEQSPVAGQKVWVLL